jgi:hypothetical protein
MASPTYVSLMSTLEPFIGRERAEIALTRQMARCNATADSLSPAQVKQIINFIMGATKILLAGNKEKQDQLEARLRQFG